MDFLSVWFLTLRFRYDLGLVFETGTIKITLFAERSIVLPPEFTETDRTRPSALVLTDFTRPKGHWPLGTVSSIIITTSPTDKAVCEI